MRVRYSIVIALAALLALAGGATANTGFVAHLDGLQEVPPNTSPATGTGFFILDNTGTLMTWSVTYMNRTARCSCARSRREDAVYNE